MNNWCQRKNLTPVGQLGRKRKLDWKALAQHIQENPDALLRERTQHFGVHPLCNWVCTNTNEANSYKKL